MNRLLECRNPTQMKTSGNRRFYEQMTRVTLQRIHWSSRITEQTWTLVVLCGLCVWDSSTPTILHLFTWCSITRQWEEQMWIFIMFHMFLYIPHVPQTWKYVSTRKCVSSIFLREKKNVRNIIPSLRNECV